MAPRMLSATARVVNCPIDQFHLAVDARCLKHGPLVTKPPVTVGFVTHAPRPAGSAVNLTLPSDLKGNVAVTLPEAAGRARPALKAGIEGKFERDCQGA
jgi:hypothetical protein